MAYEKSVLDQYSDALSGPMKDIETFKVGITGTALSLLRITKTQTNYLGDESWTLETQIVDNVILQFPLNEVETFPDVANETYSQNAINLWELLPIKAFIKYNDENYETASTIKAGDLFVHVIFDEHRNKIPLVLQVQQVISSFMGYNEVRKKMLLSMARGAGTNLESDIQAVINTYVENFGVPSVISTVPEEGYSGAVPMLEVQFNIAMEQDTIYPSGAIIVSGAVGGVDESLSYSWFSNSGIVMSGLVPDTYQVTIGTDALSTFQVPKTSDESFSFIVV